MTDDTDDIIDRAWKRKYKRHGASAHSHRQAPSALKPRRASLVRLPDSVARDMEAVFALNAEHFKQSR